METLKEKPLREEILKAEIDLRRVTDPEKFLQKLNELLRQFGVDKQSLELIPIFFPNKKWYVPRSTFISLSVPKDTYTKLRQWRQDKDDLIIDASNGELLILNETKLSQWRLRKEKQTKKREE
jgi:hypothetical protein